MKKWNLMAWETPVEGKEIECSIQDAETYEFKQARVILSHSHNELPEGDELRIYNAGGAPGTLLFNEPWFVKIVEIEEEDVPEVKVVPQKLSLGRMRGSMLETLIKQREEGEKNKSGQGD